MCGIAASVDTRFPARARPWALPFLRHRGPDGEGTCEFSGAALEHCRLAIIDPENHQADQPLGESGGRWTIVYNGELFNYKELRTELQAQGVRFRTDCDTEVVLAWFSRFGVASLNRLEGMFAFAVWDNDLRELFVVRDQIGVKPVYYYQAESLLLVASEVQPLLKHPAVPSRLDSQSAVEFLAFGHSLGDTTIVAGVRKLEPGHFLHFRNSQLTVGRYWDALPQIAKPTSVSENADCVASLVGSAVRAATTSDVPIGLMLSGGIDSTTIAAHVARASGTAVVRTYSVGFGRDDDETDVAARLAYELGFSHRSVHLSDRDFSDELGPWLESLDYPISNPTAIAVSAIARSAREDGIKVLLSGDGGDELFGGYTRWMRYLQAHELWKRVSPRVRPSAGRVAAKHARGLPGDIARRAAAGRELFVPSRPFHDDLLERCIGERARRDIDDLVYANVDRIHERYVQLAPTDDYLTWMSYVSLKTYLVDDYLLRLDLMGMRNSVEGRVPLLDVRLTEKAFGIPQRDKVGRFEQKSLFRTAVRPMLPAYIASRPKQGFCPPATEWADRAASIVGGGKGLLWDSGLLRSDTQSAIDTRGRDRPFALWTLSILSAWANSNLSDATSLQ